MEILCFTKFESDQFWKVYRISIIYSGNIVMILEKCTISIFNELMIRNHWFVNGLMDILTFQSI